MDAIERGKRLEEILAEKGMSMGLAYGSDDLQQSEEIVDREIKLEKTKRAEYLMDLYYQHFQAQVLSSLTGTAESLQNVTEMCWKSAVQKRLHAHMLILPRVFIPKIYFRAEKQII